MSIYATSTPVRAVTTRKPCARCGVIREARKDAVLCRDCRDVLTPAGWGAWAA